MQYDPTKPNAARIYDYWLDGTHNFPVDREVAEQAKQLVPHTVRSARLNRQFLFYAADQLAKAGLTCFIDLATGIPTEEYLHERVPETARIIYNDRDAEAVAYGQEIVGDRPNIRYVQSRIEEIDTILTQAERFFNGERRVGICMIGVAYFISDEDLQRVFQYLYDWSLPDSLFAITALYPNESDSGVQTMRERYRQMGIEVYERTPEHLLDLVGSWHSPGANELQPFEVYLEPALGAKLVLPSERGKFGYGGVFRHR